MVRILANGDIVEDDDPRVRSTQPTQRPNSRIPPRQEHGDFAQQGQPISIFQVLNQKLLAFGIPPFNIGDLVIQPIVSVGLLLSLLLFGIHGLIFGAILFAVERHWLGLGVNLMTLRIVGIA
ncbi:hypothetical protein RRG08_022810 [Elysia crispata]|uniref:DUF4605 domain-containing protein n=1 Tax=Elysia crispata TaxID=231223 RepID=A0AAE0Z0W3_9GAST|nr:hypothetical protein RRG08_022810 [Elysia crispata]